MEFIISKDCELCDGFDLKLYSNHIKNHNVLFIVQVSNDKLLFC